MPGLDPGNFFAAPERIAGSSPAMVRKGSPAMVSFREAVMICLVAPMVGKRTAFRSGWEKP
jgi:hypothetical protein